MSSGVGIPKVETKGVPNGTMLGHPLVVVQIDDFNPSTKVLVVKIQCLWMTLLAKKKSL